MLVPLAAPVQPAQQGLNEQQEEEGREGVALQRASLNLNWVRHAKCCSDAGTGTGVQALHRLDCMQWEAYVPHQLQQFVVIHCVKCRAEVDIQHVDVPAVQLGIFQGIEHIHQLQVGAAAGGEPVL